MADTSLTIKQIEYALYTSGIFDKNTYIMVPNISYGLLSYEADFLAMSKSGYITEVEIKRSFSDFKADFKKRHLHDDPLVYYFYYCVPEKILEKVKAYLLEKYGAHYKCPALLYYNESGFVQKVPNFGYTGLFRNKYARKLFSEEQVKFARLGCFRYWTIQENTAGMELRKIREENFRNKSQVNCVQLEIEFPEED